MKALILSAWEDTGGVAAGLKQAMERHTDWTVRTVHRHHNYIGYPTDIYWGPDTAKPDDLDDLFAEADIIHVMERWEAVEPFVDWRDKPLVLHHHGTEYRDRTQHYILSAGANRAVPIVSTLDLTLLDPNAEWLPNPCDLAHMREIRAEAFRPHKMLRISHSPTHRDVKATDAFVEAVADMALKVDIIEGVNWETCLKRKAATDLFYDQLHIGYALSGIEAMAMGIPVVAGAYERRVISLMLDTFGYLPFLFATKETLRDRIGHLMDLTMASALAELGLYHVERWHSEALVASRLASIYQRALR